MNQMYLLLGSNEKPEVHLPKALKSLAELFPIDFAFSETRESQNSTNKADPKEYSNIVCKGYTELSNDEVIHHLKALEDENGRDRSTKTNVLVTLDLDLVEWNDTVLKPKDASQSYYKDCKLDLLKRLGDI